MTEAVGEKLAVLRERNALASDFAGAASLLLLSLLGVPASTTHARNAAAAGCALLSPDCRLRKKQFLRFTAVWILTFPVCAALGVLSTLILQRIF